VAGRIGAEATTTVDIHTGSKTVLDYLIKPLNKASEALRER
jgi:adhesin transport system membrane fusion protein